MYFLNTTEENTMGKKRRNMRDLKITMIFQYIKNRILNSEIKTTVIVLKKKNWNHHYVKRVKQNRSQNMWKNLNKI